MKTPFPTLKLVAFRVTYPPRKPAGTYERTNLGSMLLPNCYFCDDAERMARSRFRDANAFRLYGNDGRVFFCGSL
jgi:hypothetical protein